MKRFFSLMLLLALMLSLISCGSDVDVNEESETQTETETESDTEPAKSLERHEYALKNNTDLLKLYGRMTATDKGITCDFAASGIEFSAYVDGFVSLEVTAEYHKVASQATKNDDIYFSVFVDGVKDERRYKVAKGTTQTLKIAYFDEPGEHTIKVLRQTEAIRGLCTLKSLSFVGTLNEAPSPAPYYIEFIGDSITSGYGNLVANGASSIGSYHNDGTQTYAFLAAQALGADFSMISCSGIGVTSGYVPMVAEQVYTKNSYFRSQETAFTPTRTPDVVVINLGTNDRSKKVDTTTFKNDVKSLIASVRSTYGKDVKIVWAYGMMDDSYSAHTMAAINELGGTAAGLYTVQLTRNNSGGGGHPNLAAHKSSAEILANFIKQNVK